MNVEDIVWDEDGDVRWEHLYTSDVTIEDVPRVIQEHRDLRLALHKAVDLLNKLNYNPQDSRSEYEWNKVVELRKRLII